MPNTPHFRALNGRQRVLDGASPATLPQNRPVYRAIPFPPLRRHSAPITATLNAVRQTIELPALRLSFVEFNL